MTTNTVLFNARMSAFLDQLLHATTPKPPASEDARQLDLFSEDQSLIRVWDQSTIDVAQYSHKRVA